MRLTGIVPAAGLTSALAGFAEPAAAANVGVDVETPGFSFHYGGYPHYGGDHLTATRPTAIATVNITAVTASRPAIAGTAAIATGPSGGAAAATVGAGGVPPIGVLAIRIITVACGITIAAEAAGGRPIAIA